MRSSVAFAVANGPNFPRPLEGFAKTGSWLLLLEGLLHVGTAFRPGQDSNLQHLTAPKTYRRGTEEAAPADIQQTADGFLFH